MSYVFTTLGYVAYWIGRFFSKKEKMMLFNSLSSFFFMISFILLNSIQGATNSILVVLRGLSVNLKDKLNKPMHWLFTIFACAFIASCIIFWKNMFSACALICMLINLVANWYFKTQQLRLATCVASIFYILFLFSLSNYIGIIFELTIIISNLASYIKFSKA